MQLNEHDGVIRDLRNHGVKGPLVGLRLEVCDIAADIIQRQDEEIAQLKAQLDGKCRFPADVTIKPDGINELDPCLYEEVEAYRNVTVRVMRCVRCGHTELMWSRQEDTEEIEGDDEDVD